MRIERARAATMVRLLAAGVIWMITVAATSCSTGDTEVGGPTFVADLTLRNAAGNPTQQFSPGEPITLELTVRNRASTESILQFASGHNFDFVVVDGGTRQVRWKWSHGKVFTQATTELAFAPEEVKTVSVVWNQVGNDGLPLAVGNYEARGVLLFEQFANDPLAPHQLGSPLRAFTIR